jgi:hypothetical protein
MIKQISIKRITLCVLASISGLLVAMLIGMILQYYVDKSVQQQIMRDIVYGVLAMIFMGLAIAVTILWDRCYVLFQNHFLYNQMAKAANKIQAKAYPTIIVTFISPIKGLCAAALKRQNKPKPPNKLTTAILSIFTMLRLIINRLLNNNQPKARRTSKNLSLHLAFHR